MTEDRTVEALWTAFLAARPDLVSPAATYSSWHFCDNQADADELVALVCAGVKRATAGALWSYELEGEPLPRVGDFSVITDWVGEARCVIQTTSVEVVPFAAVSSEFAAIEGEGDASLAYWRQAHEAAFTRELAGHGLELSEEMPVVCECFEVVFPGGESAPEEVL